METFQFFDTESNVHATRFCKALEMQGLNGYFRTYSSFDSANVDLVFLGEVDKSLFILESTNSFAVGVSWSFDIERCSTSTEGRNTIRKVFEKLNLLIVDCEYYFNKALELGASEDRIWKMPYGVDTAMMTYNSKTFPQGSRIEIYTNRKWEVVYGQEIILEAISILSSSGFQVHLTMSNVGSTKVSLERKYSDLMENAIVEVVGTVDEMENISLIQKSDLFLSASYYDGWSVSILESMACGTPVVVSNIPQNDDLIKDGINGYKFRSGSPLDLAATIVRAVGELGRKQCHSEITSSARKLVESKADFVRNIRQLVLVLSSQGEKN